jgi:hypothetical protein
MSSKAQQIREAVTAEIAKVSGIGATGSDWKLWAQETNLPAAYTILDSDSSERSPTQSKEVTARFRIATIISSETPQDAFDELRAGIEAELEDDPSLGGLALDAWVSGCNPFATAKSIAGTVYVRDVLIDVIYRHPRGSA